MKSRKKQALPFLSGLLCLLAVLLTACGTTNGTSTTTIATKASNDKQILHYPVVGDVATLDPALVQDTDSNFPIQDIFTGLVTLDANLNVKPQLASSYKVSSDNLTYTFTLKPNLTFSDGTPLTGKDVIYSIDRAIQPATKSTVSGYLSLVQDYAKLNGGKDPKVTTLIGDSLLAPDDNTVVIKIGQPAAYFLDTLAYPTSYVVNKKVVDKYGTTFTDHLDEGAGAGPFKTVSYSHTKGLDLVPNDKYYSTKPQLSHLYVDFYSDQDGMYKAYQANQLGYTPIPSANIQAERSHKGFTQTDVLTIRYFTMNYLAKPFDNIKIRQAFALALNKDVIVKTALKDAFTPSNHVIPSGMPGYDKNLTGPLGIVSTKGDATKAKQLLQQGMQEAGYSTLPAITLTFYPRNQNFKNAIDEAKQMWQDVLGVNVNINSVARAELLKLEDATKGNGNLQMWQAGWNSDYPDPQDWLSTFFSKGSDYNQFNYGQNSSPAAADQVAVQKILDEADSTQDVTQRMKLYNTAEEKIINEAGWIPLWQERVQSLTKSAVQHLVLNAQQQIAPDDWSKVYISQ